MRWRKCREFRTTGDIKRETKGRGIKKEKERLQIHDETSTNERCHGEDTKNEDKDNESRERKEGKTERNRIDFILSSIHTEES